MPSGDSSPASTPAILVVDDDAAKQLSIRAALEPLGHTIVVVDSGEAALRAVMEQEFAVILMDVKMPGMDGYETARFIHMREACERTPIIFITAYEPDEAKIPIAYSSGAVDFICTPLDPGVLRAKVSVFVAFFVNSQQLEQSLRTVTQLGEQFRDSEARTRTLLDHVADGIVTVSDGGEIESFNRAATRIFGYSEQEAIGQAFAVMLASGFRDFTGDGENAAELMGRRKDGSTFPMELDLSDVQVGARTTHIGCIRDVSDRHAYTENLARQALHFEALLEAAPDATVIVDDAGRIVIVNERAVSSFGFTRDELIGQPVSVLVPERFLDGDPAQPPGAGRELLVTRKDGSEMPVEISVSPLETADGVLVSAAIRDISDRREVQQQLRDAARFFEMSHDMVCTAREDGTFVELNGAWERTIGFTQEQLRAEPFIAFVHPDDVELTLHEIQQLFDGVDTAEFRNRFRTRDGDWRWLEWTSAADLDHGLIYAAARDVTDRVEAERDRRKAEAIATKARDAAVEASRLKSAFVANMSHEIRTPLNGVLGMTDLLLDSDLDDDQREKAGLVKVSGDSLLTIIDDILDFSKIEAGALEIEAVPFRLIEAIKDACDLVAEGAAAKGLELTVALDPDLPQITRGDPVRLRQVLINLLSNAIKFTLKGKIVVSARWQADAADATQLQFDVSDTGIGIPADRLGLLFESFTQADVSTTRRFGGTGLGLAIAKQLVELMDGTIVATSQVDQGSVFSVTLPFDVVESSPATDALLTDAAALRTATGTERRRRQATAGGQARSGRRILVAEDNEINAALAVHMLKDRGYEVAVAVNGREALLELSRNSYDAVLMDCQMPELDGYDATRELRRREGPTRHTPIIAMTAHALRGDRERCLERGMDDYLAKPIRADEFDRVLAQWAPGDDGAASDAPLDPEGLERLRSELAGPDMFGVLADLFDTHTPPLIAELRHAVEAADAAATAALAHKLKGSCLSIAALAMADLCQGLESAASQGALGDAPEMLDRISESFPAVSAALRFEAQSPATAELEPGLTLTSRD